MITINTIKTLIKDGENSSNEDLAALIAILYASHPSVHYDVSPIPTLLVNYLDERRIRHYFLEIKQLSDKYYQDNLYKLYVNARLAIKLTDNLVATLAGGLLFGAEPSRFIPSADIRCAAFASKNKDYLMLGYPAPEFIDNGYEFSVILRKNS